MTAADNTIIFGCQFLIIMSWLKKNSSMVWKYFKKDTNNQNEAQCLICKSTYKRSNGTSNLMEHLKRKHGHFRP
ncbi:BED-type domain-containing protein [Aphis craccivora]|uniref:BED-type domain-containing protein n=1 Tax=Aphis craccivora TaxID=307492 RepID=A0A6G0W7K2_APHCR|nr:BED-type domain-containing protein [Aphis craccivora]